MKDLGVTYPVAMDNDYKIWRSFNNEYWPADYFIDATGHIRFHHFGEGAYDESEKWIRTLLEEANHAPLPQTATKIAASGTEAAAGCGRCAISRDLCRICKSAELCLSRRIEPG